MLGKELEEAETALDGERRGVQELSLVSVFNGKCSVWRVGKGRVTRI